MSDRYQQIMQIVSLGKAVRRVRSDQYHKVMMIALYPDLSEEEQALIKVFEQDIETGYIQTGDQP